MAAPPWDRIRAAIRKIDWLLPPMASDAAPTHPIFRGWGTGVPWPRVPAIAVVEGGAGRAVSIKAM